MMPGPKDIKRAVGARSAIQSHHDGGSDASLSEPVPLYNEPISTKSFIISLHLVLTFWGGLN